MYEIKNCMVPNYLLALFPRTDANRVHYNLRNRNDFKTTARRTALYENSFIPSAVDCWNNLPEHLRNSPSIWCFKRILLKTKFPTSEVPLHYHHGSRRLSVIHARLRNNCSDLIHDLFNNYVTTSDKCQTCNEIENAEHFFFKCRRYHKYRIDLFTTTRILHPLNVKLLLFSDFRFSLEQNIIIVDADALHKCHKAFRKQLIPLQSFAATISFYLTISSSSQSIFLSYIFLFFFLFLKTFFIICCIAVSTWLFILCTVGGL